MNGIQGQIVTDQDLSNILTPGYWLNDLVICHAQTILKQQFPKISGFQNTKDVYNSSLDRTAEYEKPSKGFVQILFNGKDHWVCTSNLIDGGKNVKIYDSMHSTCQNTIKKQLDVLVSPKSIISVEKVQSQLENGQDNPNNRGLCGLFAIAFATSLCFGEDPGARKYNTDGMRHHLYDCLRARHMSKFP